MSLDDEQYSLKNIMEIRVLHAIETLNGYTSLCKDSPQHALSVLLIIIERLLLNASMKIFEILENNKAIHGSEIVDILANEINKLKNHSDYAKTFDYNC